MSVRKLPRVRFITPASIEIGDTIRVSWENTDVEHSRVAKVSKREYEGAMRVFYSPKGVEIFRWHPAHDKEFRVTLLDRAPAAQLSLF